MRGLIARAPSPIYTARSRPSAEEAGTERIFSPSPRPTLRMTWTRTAGSESTARLACRWRTETAEARAVASPAG
jgi:hypothetical protein